MSLPRTALGALCIVLGALALLVGAVLTDGARLLQPEAFADRVARSLADERVAALAAEQVTEAVLARQRDLTAVRPLILAAARDVVASTAFREVVRTAVRRGHAALFSSAGQSVVLSIPDLEIVLRAALAGSDEAAESIPEQLSVGLTELSEHPAVRAALTVLGWELALARYGWLALAAGAAFVVAGVWLMPAPRDALVAAGSALVVIGAGLWATLPAGEVMVANLADAPRTGGALAAMWSVGLGGLPAWGMAYAGIGVALAAAGTSLLERLDVGAIGRRVTSGLLTRPASGSTRLARGVVIAAAGLLVLLAPRALLTALTLAAGLLLALVGLREIVAVVLRAAPASAHLPAAIAARRRGWAVGGVLAVLLAVLFAGGLVAASRAGGAERAPRESHACNGAAALCDRRLDEVVFAGTHNAMASADVPSWMFPQQERGIVAQLEDGVRALLIDVHYGTPVGDRVRTHLGSSEQRAEAERVLGREGTAAAKRIRDRLVGGDEGPRTLYLCHGFCELGAIPLDSVLRSIRGFLETHPTAVILLVVEDYVAPQDLARAFDASGLAELVYRGGPGTEWPTLRAMIARGERVVTLLESGRGGVTWLLPAFTVMQETPYTFRSASDTLSCAPNRGPPAATLFQMNHWIETTPAPRPSNAAAVNTLEVLTERARRCERARGRRPNIIAVDFYQTGELLRATRALNGLARVPVGRDATAR
jgi:hypothetical protein